ncbi:hypothetical protein C8R44DRAFT_613247 [Mycena epipterygia]|nr:hypothetical protein C8R44DRAFT_613247 [Mycena epipterygia]
MSPLRHGNTSLASEYNNGLGIKYIVAFQPQLPPPQLNKKRRSNARAPLVNRSTDVHEKAPLDEVLDVAINAVQCNDQTLAFKIVGDSLSTNRFSVTWSISRMDFKKMQLMSEKDLKELVKQVIECPKVEVKLEITETPLVTHQTSLRNAKYVCQIIISQWHLFEPKHTQEEEELAEIIVQLQQSTRCTDRLCTSRFCFLGNKTAQHVWLTPLHFNTWGLAIVRDIHINHILLLICSGFRSQKCMGSISIRLWDQT